MASKVNIGSVNIVDPATGEVVAVSVELGNCVRLPNGVTGKIDDEQYRMLLRDYEQKQKIDENARIQREAEKQARLAAEVEAAKTPVDKVRDAVASAKKPAKPQSKPKAATKAATAEPSVAAAANPGTKRAASPANQDELIVARAREIAAQRLAEIQIKREQAAKDAAAREEAERQRIEREAQALADKMLADEGYEDIVDDEDAVRATPVPVSVSGEIDDVSTLHFGAPADRVPSEAPDDDTYYEGESELLYADEDDAEGEDIYDDEGDDAREKGGFFAWIKRNVAVLAGAALLLGAIILFMLALANSRAKLPAGNSTSPSSQSVSVSQSSSSASEPSSDNATSDPTPAPSSDAIGVVRLRTAKEIGDTLSEADIELAWVTPEIYDLINSSVYVSADNTIGEQNVILWENRAAVIGNFMRTKSGIGDYLTDRKIVVTEVPADNIQASVDVDGQQSVVPIDANEYKTNTNVQIYAVITKEGSDAEPIEVLLSEMVLEDKALVDLFGNDGEQIALDALAKADGAAQN